MGVSAALEQFLAVNLFGAYGVTQTFLPVLSQSSPTHPADPF